jgi:hypothetical protein
MGKVRLLDRQVSLLEYLTSGAAIFGRDRDISLDPSLEGLDRGLLHLEARFSYEKRMDKIVGTFPRTFEILGDNRASVLHEFVEACPPVDISRLVNARQFHDFLVARWRCDPPDPPYLRDVAACELACATARVRGEERGSAANGARLASGRAVRRCPHLVLLRCAYDIRPIFEESSIRAAPIARETLLAIAMRPDADHPHVFEVLPVVFDLLSALDDWIEPTVLGATPALEELLGGLVQHGLLEVSE